MLTDYDNVDDEFASLEVTEPEDVGVAPFAVASDPIGDDSQVVPADFSGCCVPCDRPVSELPGADVWAPNGNLVLAGPDGAVTDFGPPTLDIDGDDVPDSTIVAGSDGTAYLMMDVTGDNLLDGLLVVDGDGNVLTGFEIDAVGELVAVEVPAGMNVAPLLEGAPLAAEGDAVDSPGAVDGVPPAADEQVVIDPIEPVEGDQGSLGGNVVLNDGTGLVDLGPPTHDFDNDGVLESVVVNDEEGRPAFVVAEITATGEADYVAVLDPATGDIVQQFGFVDGERVEMDANGNMVDAGGPQPAAEPAAPLPDGEVAPQGTPTSGPEKIVAPGMELVTDTMSAMTYQATQKHYDIASELWWELTGGEPYPRSETGMPLGPAMVLAMLVDRPDVPQEYKQPLQEMISKINNAAAVWVAPSQQQ
jgi:hypothetical protein